MRVSNSLRLLASCVALLAACAVGDQPHGRHRHMRNARDARRMPRDSYRLSVARGMANGLRRLLTR